MKSSSYLSPYIAGLGLGVILLLAIVVSGRGVGASSAIMRTVVALEKIVAPGHVDSNRYLSKYGGEDKNPLNNWLVFEVIGILVGGAISGAFAGRVKREVNHGPRMIARRSELCAMP